MLGSLCNLYRQPFAPELVSQQFPPPHHSVTLHEAARSLGAPRWRVVRDVWVPELAPTTLSCGAIVFAKAMGAFGTAFTLSSKFEVLPITIYNEFTNYANFALAASLSITLGLITWVVLWLSRRVAGPAPAAGA